MKKYAKLFSSIYIALVLGLFIPFYQAYAVDPEIKTLPAEAISGGGATLKASLKITGPLNTFAWFQYGPSEEKVNENNTVAQSATSESFSSQITGLLPRTKYYFRACLKIGEAGSNECKYNTSSTPILSFTTGDVGIVPINPGGQIEASDDYNLLAPIPGLDQIKKDMALGQYLATVFKIGIGITIFLAVVYIILGGIQYATTDAISGKSAGKDRIMNAIWGLLLALSAYLILNTINPDLVNFNFLLKGVKFQATQQDIDDSGDVIKFAKPLPGASCPEKCVKISVPKRSSGDMAEKTLSLKLDQLKIALSNNENIKEQWAVTEAWQPSRAHKAKCHANGTCVDANFNFKPEPEDVKYFIDSATRLGLCAIYEVKSETARDTFVNAGVYPNRVKNLGGWISAPHFSVYGENCK